ncbi:MAG: HAD family phosphatase [Nitrospiraceae bacterium]|nr:MAG: HAD family phosphatase [Nitrospiraceae bacterium]
MIKAVIFDYGNVISSLDNNIFIENIAKFSEKSAAELHALIYVKSGLPELYETGHITSDEFFKEIKKLCGLNMSCSDFISAFTGIFTPIQSTLDLIERLKPDYRLGLLSNTNEWDYTYEIENIRVFPLFDTVTVSYRVKAMKPDKEIYLDALNKLDLKPEECIYIDDIREYTDAACSMGFRGIHYTDHSSLIESLHLFGCIIR